MGAAPRHPDAHSHPDADLHPERSEGPRHSERSEGPLRTTLSDVYDGSAVTIRVLRALGWGPQLLNLGYFTWRGVLSPLNLIPNKHRLAESQLRLVKKSVACLGLKAGDRVLDIACGRGQGSYYMAAAHPGCDVTAVDLLPENVTIASTLYAHTRGLTYQVGDAMALAYPDASFDKVLCLEAAFHFPNRAKFVAEAARVLKPGGRLVIVDFMWTHPDRAAVLGRPETKIVQKTWGWDDFFAVDDYRRAIAAAGLKIVTELDWTKPVTSALQWQFGMFARLGASPLGRKLIVGMNDLLRGMGRGDWADLKRAAAAHRFVNQHSRYMVMVITK